MIHACLRGSDAFSASVGLAASYGAESEMLRVGVASLTDAAPVALQAIDGNFLSKLIPSADPHMVG